MAAIPFAQELNQLLTFKSTSTAVRNDGVATEVSTVATAWARVTELGGSMTAITQQVQEATQNFEIWTRYNSKITAFTQIDWGARTLVLTNAPTKIIDRNGRQWLVMQAAESVERSL